MPSPGYDGETLHVPEYMCFVEYNLYKWPLPYLVNLLVNTKFEKNAVS